MSPDLTPDQGAEWGAGSAVAIGQRHVEQGRPCQDAVRASVGLHPFVMVCDGRGSSALSQHGSSAATVVVEGVLWCAEPLLQRCLDHLGPEDPFALAGWKDVSQLLLRSLIQAQEGLAREHGVSAAEFEFTLSLAVVGRRGLGVLQVGDSCLVLNRDGHATLAASPQTGAFAGETNFVSPTETDFRRAEMQILPVEQLTGIVGFSDGVSGKWLHHQTREVAPGVNQILDRLATGAWDENRVREYLHQQFWRLGGDDDRSVAYLVRPRIPGTPVQDSPSAGLEPTPKKEELDHV